MNPALVVHNLLNGFETVEEAQSCKSSTANPRQGFQHSEKWFHRI
jgi:hypothetical protein